MTLLFFWRDEEGRGEEAGGFRVSGKQGGFVLSSSSERGGRWKRPRDAGEEEEGEGEKSSLLWRGLACYGAVGSSSPPFPMFLWHRWREPLICSCLAFYDTTNFSPLFPHFTVREPIGLLT